MAAQLRLIQGTEPQRYEELDDDELMLLVAGEHKAPYEVLIKRHLTQVLAYALRFLGDRALAQEVAQEVFLTLWSARLTYRSQGRLRSYLLAIAHNRCRAVARRRRFRLHQQDRVQTALPHDEPSIPVEQLLEQERAAQLHAELAALDERTRTVLILRFANELSYEEIARLMGCPPGTAKSLVSRGLQKLHARLPKEKTR